MRFFSLLSAALSFAAIVYADTNGQNAITYPLGGTLEANTTLTIKWTPTTGGTITIKLLKGPPTNILDVDVLAASIPNSGSFTWNIPNSLQDSSTMTKGDRYGFKIIDDLTNTFEYSPPFDLHVVDSTFVTTSSAPATSASTSTTTSESTSATSTNSPSTTTSTVTSQPTDLPTIAPTPTATSTQLETPLQTTQPTVTPATETYSVTAAQPTSTETQPSSTESETKAPGPSWTMIGIIAGSVVGGLILAVISLVTICRCKNRRKRQSTYVMQNVMAERPISLAYGDGMYNKV